MVQVIKLCILVVALLSVIKIKRTPINAGISADNIYLLQCSHVNFFRDIEFFSRKQVILNLLLSSGLLTCLVLPQF